MVFNMSISLDSYAPSSAVVNELTVNTATPGYKCSITASLIGQKACYISSMVRISIITDSE